METIIMNASTTVADEQQSAPMPSPSPPSSSPQEFAAAEIETLVEQYGEGKLTDVLSRVLIDSIAKRTGISAVTLRGAFAAEVKKLKVGSLGSGGSADSAESDRMQP